MRTFAERMADIAHAERVAFITGDTAIADLFSRIADLENDNRRLADVAVENERLSALVDHLRDELAETTAKLSQWQDEAARLANLAAKAMHKAKK